MQEVTVLHHQPRHHFVVFISFHWFVYLFALICTWKAVAISLFLCVASPPAERCAESTIAAPELSVWPLQDDLEQKWDIQMSATSKWFPPIKRPSPLSFHNHFSHFRHLAPPKWRKLSSHIHRWNTFQIHHFGVRRRKKVKKKEEKISESKKSLRKYQPRTCECK